MMRPHRNQADMCREAVVVLALAVLQATASLKCYAAAPCERLDDVGQMQVAAQPPKDIVLSRSKISNTISCPGD